MSDPNQPPPYPGPEQPPAGPPPPPAYPTQPPPPPGYAQQPPAGYGQPQYPAYGQPQYPTGQYGQPPYTAPPQSPYAHWGYRLAAYLLDTAMLMPLYFVAAIGGALADDPTLTDDTQILGLVVMIVAYVVVAAFAIWNMIIRQGRKGASLGKSVVGIAVVAESTGTPIGAWKMFLRQLAHFLDALPCYIGYLWPLWDDKRQTFADKIMSTIVVRRPAAPQAPPQYAPAPPQH